jgi:hypothetical protein
LVHGYSADASAFDAWTRILIAAGYAAEDLHVVQYKSLTNEITIDDLGEGFDRALRSRSGLDADEPFDAIVHSTGMLVMRAWLTAFAERRDRLKHLIALAPATFGSPLAHKGRGFLGALFRGNRVIGPDFLEAGDRILDGLELGSAFTWDLAERDLVTGETFYGATRTTPFVFVLCGVDGYPFPLSLVNGPASDGTVRLAGAALNTRKFTLDLTRAARGTKRAKVADWSNVDVPVIPIEDCNHATILSRPSQRLQTFVLDALEVSSRASFETWLAAARAHASSTLERVGERIPPYQQVVFRVLDERGHDVPDYFIDFIAADSADGVWRPIAETDRDFRYDVHVYGTRPAFRCFHVDLSSADLAGRRVGIRLLASTGTELLGYHGYRQELHVEAEIDADADPRRKWDGVIDLTEVRKGTTLFYPFTTTMVEIRLDREPLPLTGPNRLVAFPL